MCRPGGRRCPGRNDPRHRAVENAKRRVSRNTAKAREAREAGDETAASTYESLVAAAKADIAAVESISATKAAEAPRVAVGRFTPAGPCPDGYIDLYHRTDAAGAAAVYRDNRMVSKENTQEAYFSTVAEGGQAEGYGGEVVWVRVREDQAEIDDEFPDGEQHFRVHVSAINSDTLMRRCDSCGQWANESHACPQASVGGRTNHPAAGIAKAEPEPVTFPYMRRTEGAANFGSDYGQDIEPSGRYMTMGTPAESMADLYETGEVTFNQPLHLDFGGDYGEDDNWKNRLSSHYSGKTGEALSQALADDGYDGIITSDKYGTSEVIDLTHLHGERTKCPNCGQWAGADHVCPATSVGEPEATLDSLNPTGTVFIGYDPSFRATAPLGASLATLAETEGLDPDDDVTVYRGVPKGTQGTLNSGDFITTNKQLAIDYAGGGDIIEQTIKAGDILDNRDEPGGEEYIYRPGAGKCPDCGQWAGENHVCPAGGGGEVEASLGATPFRGVARTPQEMVAADPYYSSAEYEDFQEHLGSLAEKHGVAVVEDQKALGLWEGEAEPASAIRVRGSQESIDALARDLSTRYQQDAVMVVRYDPDGPGSLHSYNIGDDDPTTIVSALQQAGIPGARIVSGRLEIASDEKQAVLGSLERKYGTPEVHSVALDFIEKDEDSSERAPFPGMAPGSPSGAGATWGTVKGARDGLERRYPGVDLTLQQSSGGYVVLSKIEVPKEQRKSGVGSKVMQDLIEEADKNGWSLALTPDTSFGASSKTRLEKFYRRFGFVPNKGRNKDFTTMESMIRAPQN